MSKSNVHVIRNLQQIFKFFDLYGQNVNLFINKKPKFYTTCSGLMSMGVLALIIFTFAGFINSWLNNEKMTPIPASFSYSTSELLSKNQNFDYEFTYKNYAIYWFISATLPNGSFLATKDLSNYYTYNVTYLSELSISEKIDTEPCKIDHQDIFLGFDEATIENDKGKIAINRICIKDNFKMGLFPNNNVSTVFYPEIYFSVYQCVNSTSNNNSCATQEEINEIIKYTTVQTTVPTTLYDFKNPAKLHKNIYDIHLTKLDKTMLKYYENLLTITTLYLDYGLLSDDYIPLSTNFNPNINYDPNIRNDNDPLFVFDCFVYTKFQNYYLRNLKIGEIAANLGGIINVIFLIGKIFCLAYNSIYLKFKIISSTFSFSHLRNDNPDIFPKRLTESINPMKTSISAKIAKNFSYFSYLFPSKKVRKFYQMGSKNLHEYLDIRKIIKRLQDLDKLKMILLSEDQRILFEHIPKPDVVDSKNKFSMDSIMKFKKKMKTTSKHNISNTMKTIAEDNDPINKRILEYLASNAKCKNEDFLDTIYGILMDFCGI